MKENLELAKGLSLLADIGIDVSADGKVDISDATALFPLFTQFNTLKEAIIGYQLLDDEFAKALADNDEAAIKEFAVTYFRLSQKIRTIITNFKKDEAQA